jgi:pimeloyl-ACP methyl ester carboxylesterase
MTFWKTMPGVVVLLALSFLVVAGGVLGSRVYRITHPPRLGDDPLTLTSVVVPVEAVRFESSDGVSLDGWLLKGDPDRPFVVLCHELGRSKASGLDLGVRLQKSGFNILLFDFRGHGSSEGKASTLGIAEKRDIIGAIDYLDSLEGARVDRIGVYGVGMGAHAAVLAAADRPSIKVLVLDGLYPDPSFPLVRRVYGAWRFGAEHLDFAPRAAYAVMNMVSGGDYNAADALPHLVGRDVLLVAPATDAALAREMEAMYDAIPEQRDADGNLVLLPATRHDGTYGEDLEIYETRVAEFFWSRLVGA